MDRFPKQCSNGRFQPGFRRIRRDAALRKASRRLLADGLDDRNCLSWQCWNGSGAAPGSSRSGMSIAGAGAASIIFFNRRRTLRGRFDGRSRFQRKRQHPARLDQVLVRTLGVERKRFLPVR